MGIDSLDIKTSISLSSPPEPSLMSWHWETNLVHQHFHLKETSNNDEVSKHSPLTMELDGLGTTAAFQTSKPGTTGLVIQYLLGVAPDVGQHAGPESLGKFMSCSSESCWLYSCKVRSCHHY